MRGEQMALRKRLVGVTVTLDDASIDRLEWLAKSNLLSKSEVVRKALEEYYKKESAK